MRSKRACVLGGILGAGVVILGVASWADHACHAAADGKIFSTVSEIPQNRVALVLGTSKNTRRGSANLHFNQRIDAAAELYRAGKVEHLLVSGDNHVRSYDEPSDMREALIRAGVPASAITCDYAGFRTLDSVVRAKSVFGLSRFTIVSEGFHCPMRWLLRRRM